MHRKEHKNTHGAGSNPVKYKKEIKIFFYFFIVLVCIFYLMLCISFSLLVHLCFRSLSTFFQSYNLGQLSYNSVLDRLL